MSAMEDQFQAGRRAGRWEAEREAGRSIAAMLHDLGLTEVRISSSALTAASEAITVTHEALGGITVRQS